MPETWSLGHRAEFRSSSARNALHSETASLLPNAITVCTSGNHTFRQKAVGSFLVSTWSRENKNCHQCNGHHLRFDWKGNCYAPFCSLLSECDDTKWPDWLMTKSLCWDKHLNPPGLSRSSPGVYIVTSPYFKWLLGYSMWLAYSVKSASNFYPLHGEASATTVVLARGPFFLFWQRPGIS